MELGIWLLIGILATWRLTNDITSSIELAGPLRLYELIHKIFSHPRMPEWLKESDTCPFCVSFWIGHVVAVFLPVYGALDWLHVIGAYLAISWAISGAVTLYIRRMQTIYGVDTREV